MYKIGEFSKITRMSIKTLRYYDKEEILIPDFRDENGYRYYSEDNFKKAQIILILRDIEFSISEMKEVISHCEDIQDIGYYLNDKRNLIQNEINNKKKLMKKINSYISKDIKKEEKINMYSIEQKNIEAVKVISQRLKGSVANSGDVIPKLYKQANVKVNGDMFTLYYDMEMNDDSDIEICVPVSGEVKGENELKVIEGFKSLVTTHVGPYETLNLAYKALLDYAKENNIELGTPIKETCIKGPGMVFKGNPAKYITEIAFTIVEKNSHTK